jgi:hypothetical protein
MYKDCEREKKNIKKLIKNLNFILKIHLYFTSYKDKFKKVKTENHFKNNLNVYTNTKIKKSQKKIPKIDENNFNPQYKHV